MADQVTPPTPAAWPDYELLDFGDGRRLERLGGTVLDRPCPAADGVAQSAKGAWGDALARYDGGRAADGRWRPAAKGWATDRTVGAPLGDSVELTLGLEPTPAGQVGFFPEQFANWRWIARQTRRLAGGRSDGERPRVLNLFAYTGGSTLAAAASGAAVTHVDASKPSVGIARENATRSGLGVAPIRWIVEDAVRYCRREVKRGVRYDGVVLDPPSYGHGPKGEAWRLER
ncbi:MAG: class I SAM-dependent methyltransferase, partial [Planctomycetota bacterium]